MLSLAVSAPAAQAAGGGAQASIIRGTPASIADFPSLAFIAAENDDGDGFACTGTVISPRLVLTAAHCVEDLSFGGFTPAPDYLVVTGRSSPGQSGSGEVFEVSATHVFPGFDPGTTHGDAALLVLAAPTAAPAIPLATAADSALYLGGAEVLLAGWGLTSPNARSGPESLRSTSNVVLNPVACKQRTRPYYPPYSTARQMCTTDPPDRANGGCFGDSGGPVIARRADGSPVEIGIVSTGGPRCSTKLPNIFTRADLISAWAAEWVAAIETGAPPPALQPRLPGMTRESAQGLVGGLLSARFGRLFAAGRGLSGGCRRLGPAKVKCELLWRYGPKVYLATVTVFYVLRQNAVAWDNSYSVRRASIRCLQGEHPGRCRVETRRG
jgi:secreted trypsin-like serine protease